jgi:hypothetical protein
MTVGRLPDLFTGAFAAALVLALLGDSALAADADHAHHAASITFSPLHLLQPFLQVTGELRLDDKIGAAAILGAGQVSEDSRRYGAWEVGGQFRYYLFGSFSPPARTRLVTACEGRKVARYRHPPWSHSATSRASAP